MDSSVVLNRKERGKGQIYFIMLLTPYMITEFYGPGVNSIYFTEWGKE